MARATGIEIGENAIVVAELDGSPKKFRLVGAARVLIGDAEDAAGRRKAAVAALKQALKQAKARRDAVTLGVQAGRAVIREITLPFTDLEQIRKVVKFEAESHLHDIPIEDVVVDFHKVSESGGRSKLLVLAVKKEDLAYALETAGLAGVDPLHVTVDAAGLFNLWRALPDGAGDGATVLIDVGERTTTAIVAAGDRVRQIRTIRLGADSVTRAVAADLGVAPAEAEREKRAFAEAAARPFALAGETAAGGGAIATAEQVKRDLVRDGHGGFARRLANELLRSVSSTLLDRKLESIHVTGVGAETPGLAKELGDAFGVTVKTLDPGAVLDHKLKNEDLRGVASGAGLALVGLGQNALGLEFRQEEYRFARKFDRVRTPLLFGLVLVFVAAAFLSIGEELRNRELKARVGFVGAAARKLGEDYLLPLAKSPEFAAIVGQKNPDDWDKLLRTVAPEDLARRLIRESGVASEVVSKNYGWKPGESTAAADNLTTSALTRLAAFLQGLKKAKDKIGPFTVDKMVVTEFDVTWTMSVQELTRWDALKVDLEGLDGKPTATRGNDRPDQGGMRKLEGCKLEWAKGKR